MKEYKIISESSGWSTKRARRRIESAINAAAKEGWHVISVSFQYNMWGYHEALATLERSTNANDFV